MRIAIDMEAIAKEVHEKPRVRIQFRLPRQNDWYELRAMPPRDVAAGREEIKATKPRFPRGTTFRITVNTTKTELINI